MQRLRTVLVRNYSNGAVLPEMPSCGFQPKKYVGPDYNKIQKIRADNLHPSMKAYYKKPVLIHNGNMQWLFDQTGKRYLDMFGGIVTVSVGHCHPKVTAAAVEQLNTLWHTTNIYMHPKIHEYAEKLAAKLPDKLSVVYFTNSGSEANDLAMLMARLHTKNHDIVSFRNGYHGTSPYTMGITALNTWRHSLPLSNGIHHAMNPDVYRGLWGGSNCRDSPVQADRTCDCSTGQCQAGDKYLQQLEEVFKYSLPQGKLAALFAESIQGVGGTVQFPKGYLKKAYELVRKNGGLCIADEVQTGFGRTGEHYWGFEMHGVVPDIVTMAKGIGNGYPLAAVVTTPEVAASMSGALHFNTFGGNPVASAVGLAVLEVLDEEKCQANCASTGTYFLTELAKLRDQFECVGDVRGKGLMVGVEMVADKQGKQPLNGAHFTDIWEECKDNGVLIGRGGLGANVFRLKPPMCITRKDVDFTVGVMKHAIQNHVNKHS